MPNSGDAPPEIDLLSPTDWQRMTALPSFHLATTTRPEHLVIRLDSVDPTTGNRREAGPARFSVMRSKQGRHVCVRVIEPLSAGAYIASFFHPQGSREIQVGFSVTEGGVSCAAMADEIEAFVETSRDAKLVANGIGKSGTTWLYRTLGTLPGFTCIDMAARGLQGISMGEMKQISPNEVFHGHLRCGLENYRDLLGDSIRFVHITRDLRDIVVSEYFHKFVMERGAGYPDLRHLTKDELLKFDRIPLWSSSFHAAFDELGWKRNPNICFISYEAMVAQPRETLAKVMAFCHFQTTDRLLDYVVALNRFQYVSQGRPAGQSDPASPLRNGIPGNWRDHLSAETAAQLVEYFAPIYAELGYETR